jgi:hypothetical protein
MAMITTSRVLRQAIGVAAITCGGVLLASCGSAGGPSDGGQPATSSPPARSSSGTGSGAASSATSTPAAAGAAGAQCPTSGLRAVVDRVAGGAAAGTNYVAIDFTNVSGRSCVMFGFPGVSFVTDHPGQQIGAAATRATSFGAVTVTLGPGGAAHAWLGVVDAGNYPASACHPVTAHWLRIYPPNQFSALYASFAAVTCSAKVTSGSPLSVFPVRPGRATAGHVP